MGLSRKARESVNVLERLLRDVDGVDSWEWIQRKRHLLLRIRTKDNTSCSITVSVSASDARARMNQVGDVKRELRKLGITI